MHATWYALFYEETIIPRGSKEKDYTNMYDYFYVKNVTMSTTSKILDPVGDYKPNHQHIYISH